MDRKLRTGSSAIGFFTISVSFLAANGLRNSFVLVQISRFQQIIGVYTLQAPNEEAKVRVRVKGQGQGVRITGSGRGQGSGLKEGLLAITS